MNEAKAEAEREARRYVLRFPNPGTLFLPPLFECTTRDVCSIVMYVAVASTRNIYNVTLPVTVAGVLATPTNPHSPTRD